MARALAGETFEVVATLGRAEPGMPQRAIRYTPIRDAHGSVVAAFHRVEDVSVKLAVEAELGQALGRLDEAQSRFRTLADGAPVMMWVTDPAGICTYLNRRWYDFTGQAGGAGEGYGWLDAVHPDDRGIAEHAFLSANAERRDYRVEFRLRRLDGAYRWVIDAAAARFGADGAFLGYVGSLFDIDDRREQEQALHASTARAEALAAEQAAILGQLAEGVIVTDRSGRITFVNDAATRIHGVAKLDVEPDRYSDTYHLLTLDGAPYPSDQLPLARAVRHGEIVQDARWSIRRPNGAEVLAVGTARPVLDPSGEQIGAVLTLRDDTDRFRAEAALRTLNDELEQRVASRTQERDRLWRNTQDLQVVIDGQGAFQAVSPAVTEMLGWTPEEVIGRTIFDFVIPEDDAPTQDALQHARDQPLERFENRYRHKDGGYRWIAWVAAPEGEYIYASGRHISAEKAREAELDQARGALRQAQKMEAVGQLTGGIAHDFNNMLAVVIGSLDLLARRLGSGDPRATRYVEAAAEAARRAALLTQRLLAFSRQQPLKPEPIDVNKLVIGMAELIRGSLGSDVRFETVLTGGGWHAHADPNQLENVLLNLVVNARDAMPDGGRLTVETQNAHLDARYVAAHPGVTEGQYVLIAVTDTGGGMPDAVIAKAFDPFFTTKGVGKGTGLGLSQVYGFVRQSGGHVKIYSEPGQGTTVKVYLPRLVG
ncbi:MAG TPA: PAS domain S-box protein, partial [Sphingomonas sp.]